MVPGPLIGLCQTPFRPGFSTFFPPCAFVVGGLDSFPVWAQLELIFGFQVTSKKDNIKYPYSRLQSQQSRWLQLLASFRHMSLVSLKESHVARGVDVVSFSFSPDSITRNQTSREITWDKFSIDRYQSLPAQRSARISMSRKGTYVYKFCVCDFVMEMFWRRGFEQISACETEINRNNFEQLLSVCFYRDQNHELTILQIYVQESKKEREKSGERKEKFKVCGVVVYSVRVLCSTSGGCANTYY